jgi:hypothetical protein
MFFSNASAHKSGGALEGQDVHPTYTPDERAGAENSRENPKESGERPAIIASNTTPRSAGLSADDSKVITSWEGKPIKRGAAYWRRRNGKYKPEKDESKYDPETPPRWGYGV